MEVQYLEKEDANKFLETIVGEYSYFMEKYNQNDLSIFTIDMGDMNEIKKLEKNAEELCSKSKNLMVGKVNCSDALKSSFLSQILSISKTYSMFKQENSPEHFLSIYQAYADILSDISKMSIESKITLAFVLNVIVKNGYFNFLVTGDNSRIKVLRNIREHNNIIYNTVRWNAYHDPIMPLLFEKYTKTQIESLCESIKAKTEYLLFDKNKKGTVNFILQENPRHFLKKLITLCHIQLYMLGINDKLILSETLFKDYWCKKYDLSCELKSMKVSELLKQFQEQEQNLQPEKFNI